MIEWLILAALWASTGCDTGASVSDAMAIGLREDTSECWGQIGMVLQANDEERAALAAYAEAAKRDEDAWQWPYLQAVIVQDDDPRLALELLEAAGQRGGSVDYRSAQAYMAVGDLARAEVSFRTMADAGSSYGFLGLAQIEHATGQQETARQHAQEAFRLNPLNSDALVLLSVLYDERKDRDHAAAIARDLGSGLVPRETLLEKVRSHRSDPVSESVTDPEVDLTADLWRRIGTLQQINGHMLEARSAFRESLSRRPDDHELSLTLAHLLLDSDNPEDQREALMIARSLVRRDRENLEFRELFMRSMSAGQSSSGAEDSGESR